MTRRHLDYYPKNKGTKDNESNINYSFDTIFRAETLKNLKFPPEIFLITIIICTFATANQA
jgi:hypothetical protein